MSNSLSKSFLSALGIVLLLWMAYTQFVASKETLKLIDYYHFDKVLHFLGGVFVAGILVSYFKFFKVQIFLLVVLAGIGWEVFEVLFLPEVRDFYIKFYTNWLTDTAGDIIFDMAGGLFSFAARRVK